MTFEQFIKQNTSTLQLISGKVEITELRCLLAAAYTAGEEHGYNDGCEDTIQDIREERKSDYGF